jgi:hypothetical protein
VSGDHPPVLVVLDERGAAVVLDTSAEVESDNLHRAYSNFVNEDVTRSVLPFW